MAAESTKVSQTYATYHRQRYFEKLDAVRPLQKGIFLPPALLANANLLLNKLRFAAELKNKNLRFLHAVSSYAKLSQWRMIQQNFQHCSTIASHGVGRNRGRG